MKTLFAVVFVCTISVSGFAAQVEGGCGKMSPANLISTLTDQSAYLVQVASNVDANLNIGNYAGACYFIGRDAFKATNDLFFKTTEIQTHCPDNKYLDIAADSASEIAGAYLAAETICTSAKEINVTDPVKSISSKVNESKLERLYNSIHTALYAELKIEDPAPKH